MVPQTLNMVDVVIRNIRIFKVQKSGDLRDKLVKDVSLSCEYDPQGINIKLIAGMWHYCANKIFFDRSSSFARSADEILKHDNCLRSPKKKKNEICIHVCEFQRILDWHISLEM